MKNKIIIALVTVLVLSMIASVAVYSIDVGTPAESKTSAPKTVEEEKVVVSPVDTHKVTKLSDGKFVFKDFDGKETELTFSSATSTATGASRKIYVDNNKTEYWVNNDGKVVGIDNRSVIQKRRKFMIDEKDLVTEKEAKKIAELNAKSLFGDRFDDFKFKSVEETDLDYLFIYSLDYGVDGCISGSECEVAVTHDGNIMVSAIGHYDDTKGLDPDLLADFTQDKLLDIAEANVRAVYTDSLINWELRKTQVIKTDDSYALMFLVSADYINEDGIELTNSKRFYYGLS